MKGKLTSFAIVLALAVVGAFAGAGAVLAAVHSRVALVIGNSDYKEVPDLSNPKNDATDVAKALTDIGFVVKIVRDLSYLETMRSLRKFQRDAAKAEISVIYYAGHGIEIDRQNYLIPVDAKLESDRDVAFEAIPLESVVLAAAGASKLSLVVVDACRNNPFVNRMSKSNSSRAITQGLAEFNPVGNTLVAYAAREGTTAADGEGRNSPYAAALVEALGEPGLEIGLMFRRVRDKVLKTTGNMQEPHVYGSLSADEIYLNLPVAASQQTVALAQPAKTEKPPTQSNNFAAELSVWNAIKDSENATDFSDFAAAFPNSPLAQMAAQRAARLTGERGQARATVQPEKQPEKQPENVTTFRIVEPDVPAASDRDPAVVSRQSVVALDTLATDSIAPPAANAAPALAVEPETIVANAANAPAPLFAPSGGDAAATFDTGPPQVIASLETTGPDQNVARSLPTTSESGNIIAIRPLERPELREAQERLTILQYSPGPIDGLIGRRTISAIEAFQGDRDIVVSGVADTSLLEQLRGAVSDADLAGFREKRRLAAAHAPKVAKPAATATAPAVVQQAPRTPYRSSRKRSKKSGGSGGDYSW